jgi:glutathione S-transferase
MAVTRFLNLWTDRVMGAGMVRMVVGDVYAHLHEKDLAYFRASREARFGMPLEEVGADRETAVVAFRRALDPLRALVGEQPFVGGQTPSYADYLPFSILQWAHNVSSFALLADDDPLIAWRERVADLYDGLARKALIPTLV